MNSASSAADAMASAEYWMRQALREAEGAAAENEVPVGCVIVFEGRIIGRGHNRVEALQDPTAHAEILALTAAASSLNSWRLPGVHVYVTVEPCLMCTGALILARIDTVWFGAREPKFGACGSRIDLPVVDGLNHRLRVEGGILETEVSDLMRAFFRAKRRSEGSTGEEGE